MTLTLRPTKTGLRFEYTDDDAETVVSIDKADTEADTVRKLKRVIALVEGEQGAPPPGVPEYGVLRPGKTLSPHGTEAVPQTPPTNGWEAAYAPPALPERLKGEVELVPPGEDA
ncbi:hypothetical protein [Streptomyces roseolus]|uniref:hypothetical protein n=1 Tax=Streptomyces roseolus TaxID=67358 RepID=UPI0036606921